MLSFIWWTRFEHTHTIYTFKSKRYLFMGKKTIGRGSKVQKRMREMWLWTENMTWAQGDMTVPLILYSENILVKQKSLEHRLKAKSKQSGNCTVSGFPWLFCVCTLTHSVVLRTPWMFLCASILLKAFCVLQWLKLLVSRYLIFVASSASSSSVQKLMFTAAYLQRILWTLWVCCKKSKGVIFIPSKKNLMLPIRTLEWFYGLVLLP